MVLRLSMVVALLLAMTQFAVANVSSLSPEQRFVDDSGAELSRVVVSCSHSKDSRVLTRKAESRKWCDSKVTDLCASKKLTVANKVCSGRYQVLLEKKLTEEGGTAPLSDVKKQALTTKAQTAEPPQAVASVTAQKVSAEPESKENPLAKELLEIKQKRELIRQRELDLNVREAELLKKLSALQ